MKSFCTNIAQLFELNSGLCIDSNFDQGKKKISIPKYQREFKWKDEKIISLIADVKEKSKFLGIIIVDETDTGYEIVDGQQRITTFMLILASIFNVYKGHIREQELIRNLLKPNGKFLFENESIGPFLTEDMNCFKIDIQGNDIYHQSDDFKRAFDIISTEIQKLASIEEVRKFKQKMLDCKILVLINDIHEFESPVEQLFLDINEKSQILDVEDVFKGHCFENFDNTYYEDLKNIWVNFKSIAMDYKKLGFKDVSEYIYLFLLEMKDKKIPNDLTVSGRHYLEGKTMDETETILNEMIKYGEVGFNFCNRINEQDYRFSDLCEDSKAHGNTDDHISLKKMCKEMLLESGSAIYQKLPLLTFLYYLSIKPDLTQKITHFQLRRILTNLYIYMALFVISGQRKSKNIIDHTIRAAMESDTPIDNVVAASKKLRKEKVDSFSMQQNYTGKKYSFICSVIDNFSSNDGWLKMLYGTENKHNTEHLLIMKNKKIEWIDGDTHFLISNLPSDFVSKSIKKATNYLIIDENLNGEIKSWDIVSKISKINEWYAKKNTDVPKHISLFIDYISSLPEYLELKNLKGTNPTVDLVKEKYLAFLQVYFDDNNTALLSSLDNAFKMAFSQQ